MNVHVTHLKILFLEIPNSYTLITTFGICTRQLFLSMNSITQYKFVMSLSNCQMRSCIFYTVQKYGFCPPSDPLVTSGTARPIRRARHSLDASTPVCKIDAHHFHFIAGRTHLVSCLRTCSDNIQWADYDEGRQILGVFFSAGQRIFWRF
jgi:hypothetical protein